MPSNLNICVFQHIACEHPGIFRDFLRADGHRYEAIELDEGAPVPDLSRFDALWVMGGPMDVWEHESHPWLLDELAAIREAVVDRRMPFLGFCLGHQLLAAALGGEVGRGSSPEVGVMAVTLTAAGRASPFLAGIEPTSEVLQWHSAEVGRAPEGAEVLAESPACAVQAMAFGSHAFSMQYHVEITATTVREWNAVPSYKAALTEVMGASGAERLEREAAARLGAFNGQARRLYDNWITTAL